MSGVSEPPRMGEVVWSVRFRAAFTNGVFFRLSAHRTGCELCLLGSGHMGGGYCFARTHVQLDSYKMVYEGGTVYFGKAH